MKRDPRLELLAAYRMGWKKGACSAVCPTSESKRIDEELKRGYAEGREDRISADKRVTERLGLTQEDLMKAVLR